MHRRSSWSVALPLVVGVVVGGSAIVASAGAHEASERPGPVAGWSARAPGSVVGAAATPTVRAPTVRAPTVALGLDVRPPTRVHAGRPATLRVTVRNDSPTVTVQHVRLQIRTQSRLQVLGFRTRLVGTLAPGATEDLTVRVRTFPKTPSGRRVRLTATGRFTRFVSETIRIRVRR